MKIKVAIFGAGKVGTALFRALKMARVRVALRPARAGMPPRRYTEDLLVITVRDRDVSRVAERLAADHLVSRETAVVHVSGALTAEALAALREGSAGVAQMHPMIAFASSRFAPELAGGHAHVAGDHVAVARARALCGAVGLRPRTFPGLDTIAYHAAAGLLANGAAALAAAAGEVLVRGGVPRDKVPALLGPLLRSVAENVGSLGLPQALTGPVRRGDASAVNSHLATLARLDPHAEALYRALGLAQLPLARAIGDADEAAFDAVLAALQR